MNKIYSAQRVVHMLTQRKQTFVTASRKLKNTMLNEINHIQKDKHYINSFYVESKKVEQIGTESRMMVARVQGWGGRNGKYCTEGTNFSYKLNKF